MSDAKKKVIALVINTNLTNEQIERGRVVVTIDPGPGGGSNDIAIEARNVRVLDSDA